MKILIAVLTFVFSLQATAQTTKAVNLICLSIEKNEYHLYNKLDKEQLSEKPTSRIECEMSIAISKNGLTCAHYKNSLYSLIEYKHNVPVSMAPATFESCAEAVKGSSKDGLVCVHEGKKLHTLYDRVNINDLSPSPAKLKVCNEAIKGSNNGLICSHQANGWHHLFNYRKNVKISSNSNRIEDCTVTTKTSTPEGLVCKHEGGGRYTVYNFITDKVVTEELVDLNTCVESL